MLFGIIVGLLILVLLVVAHELGHAYAAKKSGVKVLEFGVGFPPKAYSKKLKNGTLFSLNWLPLGGFVRLKGEYNSANEKGDFGAASFWNKTKILFAGVAVNWLVAVIIISGLSLFGLPKVIENQFSIASDTTIIKKPVELGSVTDNYPAAKAGLKKGDQILEINNQIIDDTKTVSEIAKQNKGQDILVKYNRDNKTNRVIVTLGTETDKGILGVSLGQSEQIKATWSAPIVGVMTTLQYTGATISGVFNMLFNFVGGLVMQLSFDPSTRQSAANNLQSVSDGVAGPIGILGTIFPAAEQAGITQLLFLTAVISLSLAVMNILPIPALDGGRWLTIAIYKLLKRNLTKEHEEQIQTIGFSIIMGLTLLVTIADVAKLF